MATESKSEPMSKREAAYKNAQNPLSVGIAWTFEGGPILQIPNLLDELVGDEAVEELICDEYSVASVDEVAEENVSSYAKSKMESRQLGKVVVVSDVFDRYLPGDLDGDMLFYRESELLSFVNGVSEDMARGMIDMCGEIETVCKEYRTDPVGFSEDADVEGWDWSDELLEIDDLEQNMKDAGVWEEPQDISGDGW